MNLFVERLGWVLVHSLWQFAFVALLAAAARRALRHRSAAARYGVHVVAMAVMVIVPVVTWFVFSNDARDQGSGLQISKLAIECPAPGNDPSSPILKFEDPTPDDAVSTRRAGGVSSPVMETSLNSETTEGLTPPARQEPLSWSQRAKTALQPWLTWIVAAWSLGVVVCSLRPLLGWHTLWRLKRVGVSAVSDDVLAALRRVSERLGLRRAVSVLQSTLAQVPVVVGYFRPVILLPLSLMTSLPAEQLEAILAHELAHVRRHDFVVNLLQTLVETLFFYHPAVWWLSHQIRVEREHCCDDLVVASLGNRIEYGRALLAIEELRGRSSVLALGANDGSLLSRIRRIAGVGNGIEPRGFERAAAVLLCLVLFAVSLGLAMNWKFAGRKAEESSESPVGRFEVKLESGITVELLGVATGDRDSQWWSPDGQTLEVPPFANLDRFVDYGFHGVDGRDQCRAFAVRFRGDGAHRLDSDITIDRTKTIFGGGSGGDGFKESLAITEPLSHLESVAVHVGIGLGQHGPPQAISPTGAKAKRPNDASPWYDVISPQRVDEWDNWTYLRYAPYDAKRMRHSVEWKAIDKDGFPHEPSLRLPEPPRPWLVAFDLPLSRVARFEYRLRSQHQQWVTFANVSLHPGRTTAVAVRVGDDISAPDAELERLRIVGQDALNRGDYAAMAAAYGTLARGADATAMDAVWLGHALHLLGRWSEASAAYHSALNLADRQYQTLEKQTTQPADEAAREAERLNTFGGPVRDWQRERERELARLREEWPQLVLLVGQVELTQLGDAAAAVKTLSRGLRFFPDAESLERLLDDAQSAAGKRQSPPHPKWSELMYPMATQRSLAQAFERLGDNEAAARCWCRIHLSFLAYQVGMAVVDADHLVEIVSRVPADKRQPFHEFVLKNPGRFSPKKVAYAYQAKLGADKRNPFRVAATLDAFGMTKLGPVHANLVKLPSGRWLMAYTGGDVFQARLFLSTSTDGTTWDAPWEFTHNNIFPAHSPSLAVDDDGTIWMLCSSQRFDINRYSSGGYGLWLCSSRDGRDWSSLRPINTAGGFQFQYQNTVQLTRDRNGTFWVFGQGQFASAKTPDGLRALQPFHLPVSDRHGASEIHATFDPNNRCHLVFVSGSDAIYRTSSDDMQHWMPPEILVEKQSGSRVTAPQLLIDGDRIALIYETFSGHLRKGRFHGDDVTWGDSIPIGLPLGGSLIARDGDRVLLPSGDISAVAAPVLLEAAVSDLLPLAGTDEPTKVPTINAQQSEWGPERHGLRTRLTLVTERPAVGRPLLLKCELQNVGTVARKINSQNWDGYRGFVVVGPDGAECEFLSQPFNTLAKDVEIKPGETRTLFDRVDIAPEFLMPSAGEHTLRLNGGPQSKVGDIEEGRAPIPPPNELIVTLAAGQLPRLQTLFLKLRSLAPPDWRVTLSGSGIYFRSDGGLKIALANELPEVALWFGDTELTKADEQTQAAKRSEPASLIRLGETEFGFGHLWATARALRDWPKCVEQIRAQILVPKVPVRGGKPKEDAEAGKTLAPQAERSAAMVSLNVKDRTLHRQAAKK